MEKKRRQATYTISVPMQITFVADEELTLTDFEKIARKEVIARLANGYFDVYPEQYVVKQKTVHCSSDEKISSILLGDLIKNLKNLRGLR